MENQTGFAQAEYAGKKRRTRRERFLADMGAVVPRARLVALITPFYSKGKRGCPAVGLEKMLRLYFLPPVHLRWVLVRDPKGKLAAPALLCTDPSLSANEIINAFVRRWSMETTFQETKAHLGFEGQRQWNDLAIARSTPLRLALFSLVTRVVRGQPGWQASVRQAAWYQKALPTFSDALAQVRRALWRQMAFCMSSQNTDEQKSSADFFAHLGEILAYAT